MKKDRVPIGQMPVAILIVANLTDYWVVIHDTMYQVHVEGEKGEPPTTLAQQRMTGKLRLAKSYLRGDEYVILQIFPGDSDLRKLQLAYFYDLNSPGKYKVYAEVVDPKTGKRLRTNTVTFEIVASAK